MKKNLFLLRYVIGRKGMGKTAIVEYLHNTKNHNVFCEKLTFKNFPFNLLYSLDNNIYTSPNQYITIGNFHLQLYYQDFIQHLIVLPYQVYLI